MTDAKEWLRAHGVEAWEDGIAHEVGGEGELSLESVAELLTDYASSLAAERDKLVGIVEKLLACFSRTSTTVTGAWEAYPGKNALPDALAEAERLLAEIRGGANDNR